MKHYFTFGCGQENEGYVQPIIASSYGKAREKMVEMHGARWAFQYSEEQWNEMLADKNRCFELEKELPTITKEA
jgi:hypothetical protein